MKKTVWTTLILAIMAGAVITYFYVFEKGAKSSQSEKEWEPVPIINPKKKINKVIVIRPSDKIVFEWQGDSWLITEPKKVHPSQIVINNFMNLLLNLKKERIIHLHPENLKIFDLEEPRAEVVFHFSDEKETINLFIGKMNYNQDHAYAKLRSKPAVFLIKPEVTRFLFYSLNTFRAKSLLLHSPSNVESMEIKVLAPRLRERYPSIMDIKIIRQAQKGMPHEWIFIRPFKETSKTHSVELLLDRLHSHAGRKVIDVKDGNFAEYGLDDPQLKLIFNTSDGKKEEVLLGDVFPGEDKAYFRNTLTKEVILTGMQTFQLIAEMPFRKELLLDPHEARNITRMEIDYPGLDDKGFTLVYDSPRIFAFKEDPSQKALLKRILAVIQPFRRVRMQYLHDYPPYPRAEYGLENPRVTIKAYENETLVLNIAMGDTVTENQNIYTYVEDLKRECIVVFPKDLYHHLPWKRKFLAATDEEVERAKKRRRRHERKRESSGQKSGVE